MELGPPGPGELLVAIDAATTCGTDVKVYRRGGHPRMLTVPTPFGHELAGTVTATGPGAEEWPPGCRVVVANSASCGRCRYCRADRENLCPELVYLNGAFADAILVPAPFVRRSLYRVPEGLPPERAALAEPLACVLHGIELCRPGEREDALVLGGGPIGLLFVATLAAGGHRVTLADPNPPRLAVGRAMGAAQAVEIRDRTRGAREAREAAADELGFTLAVDATGSVSGWATVIDAVRPGGVVSLFGGCAPGTTLPLDTHRVHYSELTLIGPYHHRPPNFASALDLLASERLAVAPLLSARRPLAETREALESMIRRETLKVVIDPAAG